MGETKDPAIKLFGKTIPLSDTLPVNYDVINHDLPSSPIINDVPPNDNDTGVLGGNMCPIEESGVPPQGSGRSACQELSTRTTDNSEASSDANEKLASEPSKSEEEKTETSVSQDKTLKKPDKIIPCPRCNSMETKFCYYNNYNVNQPRHFCKKCQRYWTAGGTMRNVPVGAGRRKNKNSSSQYRQISVAEALQNNRTDIPNEVHSALQANGAVLAFGSDSPLCESMVSILNLAETNGFQKPEELKVQIPFVEDASKSSPKESASPVCLPYPSQIPCYPGPPWPFPWNSTQWSPPVATPPFCPNGLALPFYPAPPYWGCMVPGTWSNPWVAQPYSAGQSGASSGPNSPTLGKHSRDGNMLTSTISEEKESESNGGERSLWIPKTLRIDDPGEAAKSSIWTTLGIKKSDKPESIGRGSGLFKAFQSKCDEKINVENSMVLEANPAAMSRSQNFQESS